MKRILQQRTFGLMLTYSASEYMLFKPEPLTFHAYAVALETDCGKPLVDVDEHDKEHLRYYAYGLNQAYHPLGKGIVISIREVNDDDLSLCTAA
ncbi:hypothetical protein [Parapedobacter sp.]